MDYSKRYVELKSAFQLGADFRLGDTKVDVRFFSFSSCSPMVLRTPPGNEPGADISENNSFVYPVFVPSGKKLFSKAILLLHGLNERSWDKYLTWAEYLCSETGKPVILFPIAYHMNRSPQWWANPRELVGELNLRRDNFKNDSSVSFANVALSKRLSDKPSRFYLSGRQTFNDLVKLTRSIKSGENPFFKAGVDVDIFSYSIGSFLSQVLLMANPNNLFSDSKLFMFCGGSIFSCMSGISKSIMDKDAFDKIQDYYIHTFGQEPRSPWLRDNAFHSFESMIAPQRKRGERLSFFKNLGRRLCGISLEKDIVIPYRGVTEALGENCAKSNIQYIDFPTQYSHENPFPINGKNNVEEVNNSFLWVFRFAANFLA